MADSINLVDQSSQNATEIASAVVEGLKDQGYTSLKENLAEIHNDFVFLKPFEKKINGKKDEKKTNKVNCDLAIVLDCTGSMGGWINQCKEHCQQIIEKVKAEFKDSEFRVGFVAYRDFGDNKRLEIFPFISSNYQDLDDFIYGLTATGGSDTPEDIAGGLDAALNQLEWKSEARLLILIADAPCHGKKYHDFVDSYPNGDPNGLDIDKLVAEIGRKGIDFSAIEINYNTKQMFSIFSQNYQKTRGKELNMIKLGSGSNGIKIEENFGERITRTVAMTITETTFKTGSQCTTSDKLYQKAFRILKAHKGLLNTSCMSVTELSSLQQHAHSTLTQGTIVENANKIEEVNEDDMSSEEEEEECKQSKQEKEAKYIPNRLKKKNIGDGKKNDVEMWVNNEDKAENDEDKDDDDGDSKRKKNQAFTSSFLKDINWEIDLNSNKAFHLSCNCITPYVKKEHKIDWNQPEIRLHKLTSKLRVMKQYFSEGAMRYAFYAYDPIINQKLVAKLHKNLIDNLDFNLMKRDSMSLIACHYFAEEFNSRILLNTNADSESPILLNFVDSTIYEVIKHENKNVKYYFVENYIEGDYQKYNNNAGWTNEYSKTQFNDVTQAFSHFTWQFTQGQLLVVDIQGGQLGVLTDPQIHTKNRSKLYGQGDLGYEGMLRFFYTHKCNQFCKSLGLIHPRDTGEIPNDFNFFSDLYGLQQVQDSDKNKENERIKEEQRLMEQEKDEEMKKLEEENKIKKELEDEEEKENEIITVKLDQKSKQKKKKKGQALKNQYEKERLQKEQEELENQRILAEKAAKLAEEAKKEPLDSKTLSGKNTKDETKAPKAESLVGTQCQFCKKCFFFSRKLFIEKKLANKDIICQECELAYNASMLDLACMKCGALFQISKFGCKIKKMNLIGYCEKCRE